MKGIGERKDNNAIIWDATSMNSFNQYTKYSCGNGLITTKTFDGLGMLSGIVTDTIQNLGYVFNAETGNLTSRRDNRRNPDTWTYTNIPATTFSRGYTGHEHIDQFSLINMNGRMYDPVLGRFLSPDPFFANPFFTQDFNRYSYVINNPLKYIDPSGYKALPDPYEDGPVHWYVGDKFNNGRPRPGGDSYTYGGISSPGVGDNGPGLDGVYYDWSTGNYRSTESNNVTVDASYALNIVSPYTVQEFNYWYSTGTLNIHITKAGRAAGQGGTSAVGNFFSDHFYVGAEGEITYGVQLSGIVYKGVGLNLNPVSQVVAEGKISNRGSYANSYPIVPAAYMDKGKALDFGAAWVVGGNYNWNIENGKYVSSTFSLGVFGVGGSLTWDKAGVTNLFLGFEIGGKVAAGWGAGGSAKIGFNWDW